jgi:hypothetical protein
MNVASVFTRLTGPYLAPALSISPILKIGPIPTPGTPESTLGPAAGIERHPLPRASTFRTLLGYQLPPRAVAAPRELSVSTRGAILLAVAAAIYGASALLSWQPDQQPAREQLYSHHGIDSRDGKLVMPSQVALTPI